MFAYPFGDQETELTNIKVPWDLELEGAVKLQNINIAAVLGPKSPKRWVFHNTHELTPRCGLNLN